MSARSDQMQSLRAATERLCAPAAAQIAYLNHDGPPRSVDELALEFDDFYPSVRHWVVDDALAKVLSELDHALELMSDGAELWSPAALSEAAEWENVRSLAQSALHQRWVVGPSSEEAADDELH